jgi:hypothetical protein
MRRGSDQTKAAGAALDRLATHRSLHAVVAALGSTLMIVLSLW